MYVPILPRPVVVLDEFARPRLVPPNPVVPIRLAVPTIYFPLVAWLGVVAIRYCRVRARRPKRQRAIDDLVRTALLLRRNVAVVPSPDDHDPDDDDDPHARDHDCVARIRTSPFHGQSISRFHCT